MTVLHFLFLAALGFVLFFFQKVRWRLSILLLVNVFTLYWLEQFSNALQRLSFWLPTATIGIVIFSWSLIASEEEKREQANVRSFVLIVCAVLGIAIFRFLGNSTTVFSHIVFPRIQIVFLFLLFFSFFFVFMFRFASYQNIWIQGAFFLLVLIFVALKLPGLNQVLGQKMGATSKETISWLGYSYFAFRIIHTLRDHQNGVRQQVSLAEYFIYVTFFPAFMAGPIDRLNRFLTDLRQTRFNSDDEWLQAIMRFSVGLFKKFILADSLAYLALSPSLLPSIRHTGLFWLSLYAYAFQIYFDFSGYTDIAIGVASLLGVHLPENFSAPYTKQNLTQFWNSWHITLTLWFRAYFFNPLQRFLRNNAKMLPLWTLVLLLQLATMTLIGLWHGIRWSFVIWGAWHGLGLFIHNRWKSVFGAKIAAWSDTSQKRVLASTLGVALTFHYVAVGWVFFALPDRMILPAIQLMLGLNS